MLLSFCVETLRNNGEFFLVWGRSLMEFVLLLRGIVVCLLAVIAVIDLRTMEIPDELNLALGICALCSIWADLGIGLAARLIGAVCVSVPMLLICMAIPGAFGGGDIKLVFVMGLYLGWKLLLTGVFLAFLIGGIQAFYLLLSGKAKAGEGAQMSFGPALCVGMIIAMFWGNGLLSWYFGLFC